MNDFKELIRNEIPQIIKCKRIQGGPEVGRASTVQHSCIMIARKAEPIDVLLHNPRMEFRIATSSKPIQLFDSDKHMISVCTIYFNFDTFQ